MKKIMLIGATGAGKTTLKLALADSEEAAVKTQAIVFDDCAIDTPGEYMENPRLYRAILSTAVEAEIILFVQDATKERTVFPPGFAQAFSAMSIGVITKIDCEDARCEKAERFFKELNLKGPIFRVSSVTHQGIRQLQKYLGL